MRHRLLASLALVPLAAAGLIHCVGDTPVVQPGLDASTDGTIPSDGTTGDSSSDGSIAESGPPTPDGGLAWIQHFNTNVELGGVAAKSAGGFVVGGSYRNGGGSDTVTNIGSFQLAIGQNSQSPFLAALDPQGNPVWTKVPATVLGSGQGGDAVITSVATDAAGDVYIAGWSTRASITLAQTRPGTISFIAKLKGDGSTFLWDHVFSSTSNLAGPKLAVNGTKVVATMSWSGTLTYDTSKTIAALGSTDVAVLALDASNGVTTWATSYGSVDYDSVSDIAVDATGDAWVVGSSKGTVNGTGTSFPLVPTTTDYAAVVFRFAAADGKGTYAKAWGNSVAQSNALAVDTLGSSVVVAGQFGGGVDFGNGLVGATGSIDGFVLVFDAQTKATKFVATVSGTDFENFQGVAFDPWGQVFATGQYTSADPKIGSTPLKPATYKAAGLLVAKWNASGNLLWTNSVKPTSPDGGAPYAAQDATAPYLGIYPTVAKVTKGGFVVIGGGMTGGANFGDGVFRPRLSGMGAEYLNLCLNPPCAAVVSPDHLVASWAP